MSERPVIHVRPTTADLARVIAQIRDDPVARYGKAAPDRLTERLLAEECGKRGVSLDAYREAVVAASEREDAWREARTKAYVLFLYPADKSDVEIDEAVRILLAQESDLDAEPSE